MTVSAAPASATHSNTAIRIASLPDRFLDRARGGIDDQGQPVKRLIAEGGEPCRDVLRRAHPGEELILASFSPFTRSGPYKEYGPVFILANASDEQFAREVLPTSGASAYLRDRFVIRAYSEEEEIVDAAMCTPGDAAATVGRFFESEGVAFLHVRFPTYGCFALRIDR